MRNTDTPKISKTDLSSPGPEKVPLAVRPKLFMLYEDENEHHHKVVHTFARYLSGYCQCDVMVAEMDLDKPWVHQDLSKANYAIVVNSEGAYKAYASKFGSNGSSGGVGVVNSERSPNASPKLGGINSLRRTFLSEERYDKIVMVYFEYTDEQFIIPDICPGYKYKLMKNFTDFLLHIHKLDRTDNLAQYDIPFEGDLHRQPIGQQLRAAITEATKYEQTKKSKPPKVVLDRFPSDDSRYDSGLPPDLGTPGQTPVIEGEWPLGSQDKLLAALKLHPGDAITISPSLLGIDPDIDGQSCTEIQPQFQSQTYTKLPYTDYETPFSPEIHQTSPQMYTKLSFGPTKPRPMLNIPSAKGHGHFQSNQSSPDSGHLDSIPDFLPPDDIDNFETASKTQSEQMQIFNQKYYDLDESDEDRDLDTSMNDLDRPERRGDRFGDLQFLQESCSKGEVVSLGGESVWVGHGKVL